MDGLFFIVALILWLLSVYHLQRTESYKNPRFVGILIMRESVFIVVILAVYSLIVALRIGNYLASILDPFVAIGSIFLLTAAAFYSSSRAVASPGV